MTRQIRRTWTRLGAIWIAGWTILCSALPVACEAEAQLSVAPEPKVLILLDNSGSMFPGYRPGGPGKSQLGTSLFRESPAFRLWLEDLAHAQSNLNAREVALSIFTSGDRFAEEDIRVIAPPTPIENFSADNLDQIPDGSLGKNTFLIDALAAATTGFEGIVWLITDNYADTGSGSYERQVREFFESFKRAERYRAVHLFVLPERQPNGPQSDLAIYAIVVSTHAIETEAALRYDRIFNQAFREANRPQGRGPLFPGRKHLKLWNLSQAAIEIKFKKGLDVIIYDRKRRFSETEEIELPINGKIQSNLTEHRVVAGNLRLEVEGEILPEEKLARDFGLGKIEARNFSSTGLAIPAPLRPAASKEFDFILHTKGPVKLEVRGFVPWLKAALLGLQVEYRGNIRTTFSNVEIELDQETIEGVFGSEFLPEVFGLQRKQVINPLPESSPIAFTVRTGSLRAFELMFLSLPLLLLVGALARLWRKRAIFSIVMQGKTEAVRLHRLQSHSIRYDKYLLGQLIYRFDGRYEMRPNRSDVRIVVRSVEINQFRADIRDIGSIPFTIDTLVPQDEGSMGEDSSAGPPRPPSRSSPGAPFEGPIGPRPTF